MNEAKKQRGRPRADMGTQRAEILNAAMAVLVERGYQKTTTLIVAKTCGISKQTLYNHFSSKEELFIAVVESRTIAMNNLLAEAIADLSLNLEDVLKHFGRLVLGILTSDVSVAINRACMTGAASKDMSLSAAYFEHGQEPVRQKLIALLKRAQHDKLITYADVDEAFQALLGLYYGDLQLRRLLGVAPLPTKEQIAEKAEDAVDQFMRLFGTRNT